MAETLADIGEFGLIDRVTATLRRPPGRGELGPGDDAALLSLPGLVAATTDLLVEGRHFRFDWSRPEDVGAKAAAQNLADVVAMGAAPRALLVGLGAPASLPVSVAEALVAGLEAEAARAGAYVVGGDVVRSDAVVLAVTALGSVADGAAVRRDGARPGNAIAVVGQLGASAAGLALLRRDDPQLLARHAALVGMHRRPQPDYAAALVAARAGATAMTDVSDGFAADLGHVLAASGVGAQVDVGLLPMHPALAGAARDLGLMAAEWAQAGGEDHAFVVTLAGGPPPPGAVLVGRITDGAGLSWSGGAPPTSAGHDHFAAP